jgi:predicted amidohydrolase
MKELRVAAVQMSPTGDRKKNIETASRLMDKAVGQGAQIIGLPEDFSYAGDTSGKLSFAMDEKTDPAVAFLRKYAKKNKVAIIGGSIPFKTGQKNKVSNTCLVIDTKGNIAVRYDKMHLFDVSLNEAYMLNESGHIKGGDRVVTIDLLGTTIGLTICYDLRFPELSRALTLRGAKIIFVCAAFTLYTGKDHWEALLRARAIENQCYVVAPAQFGEYMPGVHTYGRTMIIDPWGQVLTKCQDKEDVIVADLDMEYLEDVRRKMPCLEHTNKKTFFSSKVYKKQS